MIPRFHGVKTAAQQRAFFRQAREAAPSPLELAKVAMLAWVENGATGVDHDHREAFAASFAACGLVDTIFTKMAEAGEITAFEREKLAEWTAEAACRDLENMTKTATSKWMGNIKDTIAQGLKDSRVQRLKDTIAQGLKDSRARGAIGGALAGAATGAYVDKDDRLRGAAMYALPGAAVGALAGHAHHEWEGMKAKEVADKAKEIADKAKADADKLQASLATIAPRREARLETIAPRREAMTDLKDLEAALAPILKELKLPQPDRVDILAAIEGLSDLDDALATIFTKRAEAGEITAFEREKLAEWTAEAACRDLENMTKTATSKWMGNIKDTIAQGLKDSRARGAIGGALAGAATGAYVDKDDRLRGAAMYAMPGAALGALAGQVHHEWKDREADKVQEILETIAPRREAMTDLKDLDAALAPILKKLKFQPETPLKTGYGGSPHWYARTTTREPTPVNLSGGPVSTKINDFGNAVTKHWPSPPSPEVTVLVGHRRKQGSLHEKLADIVNGYAGASQGQAPGAAPFGGDPNAGGAGDPNAEPETIGDPGSGDAGMLDELMRSQKTIDNMIFLAQQVNMPELAQDLNAQREQLSEHFAAGNGYLPAELQHHFPKSEHAEQFMKKYKQRFGSPVPGKSGGSK